jgi:excisionase family DNA binding protein
MTKTNNINEITLVDATKAADFLGISKSTLYNWVYQGKVPYLKLFGLLRFDLNELGRLFLPFNPLRSSNQGGANE